MITQIETSPVMIGARFYLGDTWSEFEQPTSQMIGHNYIDLLCMDFDPKKEGHVMVGAKSGLWILSRTF